MDKRRPLCGIRRGVDCVPTRTHGKSSVSPERIATEVDGRRLSLSNLEKVLWPETGFTKGEMIHYYAKIADVMLPHIQDRPITLKRFPERSGRDGVLREARVRPSAGMGQD